MKTTSTEINVERNASHPWSGKPGFDLLMIKSASAAELHRAVKQGEARYWHTWICGEQDGAPAAVMYKPCGARSQWVDDPDDPHPGITPG